MKTCTKCDTLKNESEFYKAKNRSDGISVWCAMCNKKYYTDNRTKLLEQKKKHYSENVADFSVRNRKNYQSHYISKMICSAKRRAKLKNLPFSITSKDIVIPSHCPVLGIELQFNKKFSQYNSPSLDKVIPQNGYVHGNIVVVSLKANQIKNCATVEELEKVYKFYRDLK